MQHFKFFKLILILLSFFVLNSDCNKKINKQENKSQNIKLDNVNCTQVIVKIETCSEKKSLNKRFNFIKIKNWIYEQCQQMKKVTPDKYIDLTSCINKKCDEFETCLNNVLNTKK